MIDILIDLIDLVATAPAPTFMSRRILRLSRTSRVIGLVLTLTIFSAVSLALLILVPWPNETHSVLFWFVAILSVGIILWISSAYLALIVLESWESRKKNKN